MPLAAPSRRDALKTLLSSVGVVAGGLSVVGPALPCPAGDAAASLPLIDTHVHIASSRLARGLTLDNAPSPFNLLAQPDGAQRLGKMIGDELTGSRVTDALCMPTAVLSDADPLGIQPTLEQAQHVSGAKLHPIGVAHPERFDREHLRRVEEVLKQGQVKAFKAYLGYLHYGALNPGYRPYYLLAAKYNIPVIFHTGDTYSRVAKLKYTHPLQMDEVAVDFPATKFVLAHFGNPWIMDAAQVAYKNKNVWIDLSAILIGDASAFQAMERNGSLDRAVERLKHAIDFVESPDRFVFGSDWPLSPIADYRRFVERLFPAEQHAAVMHENARTLFNLR